MHPLKTYMNKEKLTGEELSKRIGIRRSTLYRIMAGNDFPLSQARRIVLATDRAVKFLDLAVNLKGDKK